MADIDKNKSNGSNLPKGNKKNPGGVKINPKFNLIYVYGFLLLAFFVIQYMTSGGDQLAGSQKYDA